MIDQISRQAAIEALERIFNFCEEIDAHLPEDEKSGYKMFPDYKTVRTFLVQLSSAEKKGEWIHESIRSGKSLTGYFLLPTCSCSECGGCVSGGSPYCPNCGAKMKRSESDE